MLPVIGSKGLWSITAPFNGGVNTSLFYECTGIQRLSVIASNGDDPYELYYQPHGLTVSDADTAISNGVYLVTLQSDDGIELNIPSDYLADTPDMTGYLYREFLLGVELGELPDTTVFTAVRTAVRDVVQAHLGVTPVVNIVAASSAKVKTEAENTAILAALQAAKTSNSTDYLQVQTLTAENIMLREKLAIAEQYILTHHVA